jgi:transglutaminase-like putative cysteine protease
MSAPPPEASAGRRSVRAPALLRWAIIAAWLALVGLLVREQWVAPPPAEPLADLGGLRTPSSEEWMGMYHGAQKIGWVHLSVYGRDGGYDILEESLLRLTLLDTPQTVRIRVRARTGEDHALETLAFELDNGTSRFRAEGERTADVFRVRTIIGVEESTLLLPADGPIFLPASVRRYLARGTLEPGKRYEVRVFDPSVMKGQEIVATVVREEEVPKSDGVRGWRIEEEYAGVRSVAWLDADGSVVREEGPMGLVLVRETEEVATRRNWAEGAALDLVASVSIPVEPPLPAPLRLGHLELRVSGIELERVPTDERQSLDQDRLTVSREEVPADAGYELPYGGDDRAVDLASTALLQSDHPRVLAVAREALGDATDPSEAVRRLMRYVYGSLRKVPTVSVPNALQVLDMKEGDCNEHAVLFGALARAVGLPARVVAGVVYANGAFQYHAWNEVWLGGRWISLDPVFDQFPADVTHVKFVSGDPEDHLAMIGVIGRLRLDVVDHG